MKNLMKLLFVPLLTFFSCTQQLEGIWDENEPSQEHEIHSLGVCFSRSSIETFAEQGITEVGVYVYLEDSMVFGKKLSMESGNIEVALPLGENLETFVVANADQLIDVDNLSKVVIRQNDNMQKPVYISDIVRFTSDNTVSTLNLELKRLVGQAVFSPNETDEKLDAITHFNALDVTFTNVGVAYKVKSKECILENVTVRTDRSNRFNASVYSFPTSDSGSRTAINVVYLKDGEEVNRIGGVLDAGISFEPSKRSTVHIDFLNEDFLEEPWMPETRAVASMNVDKLKQSFTIEKSEF